VNLSNKNKASLVGVLVLGTILFLLAFIGEIILPFILAIFCAYLLNPLILKIQKKIRNRNLAITVFLLLVMLCFSGIILFLGEQIIKDSKRFVSGVELFANQNEAHIKNLKNSVVNFADGIYESDTVQREVKTLDMPTGEETEKNLMSAIKSVYSFFESSSKDNVDKHEGFQWNWLYMLIYTFLYLVLMLYTYAYFERKYARYGNVKKPTNKNFHEIWGNFKIVFLNYFSQRTKVVLLSMSIFILSFSILNLPGAVIIGIIAGLLTYAAQFHYLSLPLAAIGCWILSVEQDPSFSFFFGIVLAIYILISVLEITVFYPKIMKSINGMNPAITLLSFTLWISLFGAFTGTIIALPLTQLILIYIDHILLSSIERKDAALEHQVK